MILNGKNTMEDKLKSQICTTVEQSQRLLALGLKPETADMQHVSLDDGEGLMYHMICASPPKRSKDIPAWSLHRLIQILDMKNLEFDCKEEISQLYDIIINAIEYYLKAGSIDKEHFNHEV